MTEIVYTLKVNQTAGEGTFSASWEDGSATKEELQSGVKIKAGTQVVITAKGEGNIETLTGTPEFVWNNTIGLSNKPYILIMDRDQSVDIDFRIIYFKLSLVDKDGKASITAYWDTLLNKPLSSNDFNSIRPDTKIYLSINPAQGNKCTGLVGIDPNSANADNTRATVTLKKDTTVTSFTTYLTMIVDAGAGKFLAYLDEAHTKLANLNEIIPGSKIYLVITPPSRKRISSVSFVSENIKENPDKSVYATIIADVDAKPVQIFYSDLVKVVINSPTNPLNKIETYLDSGFTKPLIDSFVDRNAMLYFKIKAIANGERLSLSPISSSGSILNLADLIIGSDRKEATHKIKVIDNTTISTFFVKFFKVTIAKPSNQLNKIETYLDAGFTKSLIDSFVDENTILYFKIQAIVASDEVDPTPIKSSGSALNNGNLRIADSYKEATHQINITQNTNISSAFITAFQFSSVAPYTVTKYTGNARVVTITTDNAGNPISHIGANAFGGYDSKIEEVVLPNSIRFIEEWAFGFCLNLTTINFPEGLTNIGANAFWCCAKLNNILFPTTLKSIGERGFGMGNGIRAELTNIKFKATTPPSIDLNHLHSTSETFLNIQQYSSGNATILVPAASEAEYKKWGIYAGYIKGY